MRKRIARIPSILKATSDDLRIELLGLLDREGPKSYSELMKALRLNPVQDAGRFAYHLKILQRENLVNLDRRLKKYKITELGTFCSSFIVELKRSTLKQKPLIRTSHLKIEEFNRGRIVADLIREANVPISIAKRIARDIESQIAASAPRYLTGPLIREMIDYHLIRDAALEDYRYDFTRLGLPIYNVTEMLTKSSHERDLQSITDVAGRTILKEYTLLKVLDRETADAHMFGYIDLKQLGTWFKPDVIWHDPRIFLKSGLPTMTSFTSPTPKPRNLDGALFMIHSLLSLCSMEVSREQVIDHFNVILAPFAQNIDRKDIKRSLGTFVYNLSRTLGGRGGVNLGLDFWIPKNLGELEAIGRSRRRLGVYDEYEDEARDVLSCLLELVFADPLNRPVFTPSTTLHISSIDPTDNLFVKAHRLALKRGTPFFSCMEDETASFSSEGLVVDSSWMNDWEVDTMRIGNLGTVAINLPRIILEAGEEWPEKLDETMEIVVKALKTKTKSILEMVKRRALPILSHEVLGEPYFRVANSLHLVEIIGLDEAAAIAKGGQHIHDGDDSRSFAVKLIKHIVSTTKRFSRKPGFRITVAKLRDLKGAKRFAELNVKHHGRDRALTLGTKREPYYTSCETVPYDADIPWEERLKIEGEISQLVPGGHMLYLPLARSERTVKHLIATTKEVRESGVRSFTYTRALSYCSRCLKTIIGIETKCPFCSSTALVHYDRKN
ncbi:MAG: anaerobic ribonucleoside-triphosphate reductase [Candidatus Bathyarchaeia archaeon]